MGPGRRRGGPGSYGGHPEAKGKPMRNLFSFFGGRKSTLVITAIVATAALTCFDKITVDKFLELLPWLVGIGAGSIALEDGLGNLNKRK